MRNSTPISRREAMTILCSGALIPVASSFGSTPAVPQAVRTPNKEDLIFMSAAALAEAIRAKRVSSEEVVRAHIERIQEVNPKINAVVQLVADNALKQAREADAALARGEIKGPLHGVPVTIKDSLDTAGVISTGGTKGRASFVPKKDAIAVARILSAGAILLGKTNTPEFTFYGETDNLVYGRTNNPYNLLKTPGGSSGGAAAIIASGGSPLDLGSDTGGSIRAPSHCCGISGIKPTSGRVPRTGHIVPFAAGLSDSLTQIGPLARYVEDLILALPIIAGPDWRDPAIVGMPLGNPHNIVLKDLRIAYHTDNGIATPIPEIVGAVKRAAEELAKTGIRLEERRPTGIEQTKELNDQLWTACTDAEVRRFFQASGTSEGEISPFLRKAIDALKQFKPMTAGEVDDLMARLDLYRSSMLSFMEDFDAILCPVNAYPALEHGLFGDWDHDRGWTYTYAYNLTGWPGVVVRGGTTNQGIPVGVQVVARPWREDVALAIALHLEKTLGGWQKPQI